MGSGEQTGWSGRATAALALMLAACGGVERTAADPLDLAVIALADAPEVEIGVVEGDEEYTFVDLVSVLRLADGSIAVSDAGTERISIFGPDGAFLRSWGSQGDGPGEFRSLSRLYRVGEDSLLALDSRTARLSAFALDGAYDRQIDAVDLSGDSIFRLDVWLHGRFWVDGALGAAERARVRGLLDALPPPRAAPGYRLALVTGEGGLWIREPGVDAAGLRTWTVTDPEGRPVSTVDVPERFHPLDISGDEVLGRWLDENDVHFVRAYALRDTGAERPAPAWLASPEPLSSAETAPEIEELTTRIRGAIRTMASAQEIHYARRMTYTSLVDSLEWEGPEGIQVDFARADRRGWSGVFSHPSIDRICGLAYGAGIPPGWVPGMVICAPEPAQAASGAS